MQRAGRWRTTAGTSALVALLAAGCGGSDMGDDGASEEPAAAGDAAQKDASEGDVPLCADLFVAGMSTEDLLEQIPTDSGGFQVCLAEPNNTVQFATFDHFCVNDQSKVIKYNNFGYGFAGGEWVNLPENTPLGTGLPVC